MKANATRPRPALALPLAALLLLLGLLGVILSRDLLQLYLAWEAAGLAVWFALTRGMGWRGRGLSKGAINRTPTWLLLALHSPGWLLLAVMVLGLAVPLTPPVGGVAQPWPLAVAIAFGAAVMMRSGCWPFNAWPRMPVEASGSRGAALLSIYCLAAPCLLAKALVAAPWDATGIWALTLMGTAGLLGVAFSAGLVGAARIVVLASAHAAGATIGFGLAPGSPLAAMGAVALMLSGALWLLTLLPERRSGWASIAGGWSALLGGSLGAWAITQAALGLRYGVVAVVLLPAWVWLALREPQGTRNKEQGTSKQRIHLFLVPCSLFLVGIFPQAVVEWALRPVVGAMAGGVGALRGVETQWGVGLLVRSGEDTLVAALPATGMALAVALAWVALYWLSRLAKRFISVGADTWVRPHDETGQ